VLPSCVREEDEGGLIQSLEYMHSAGERRRGQHRCRERELRECGSQDGGCGLTVSIEDVEGIHLDRHGSGCTMLAFTCLHLD
jgi:hypothetical protein